jgi:prepilin-type N-terminal cleavage/methylation domain-containing protein
MMRYRFPIRFAPQPPALPGVGTGARFAEATLRKEKPPAEPGAARFHTRRLSRGVTLIELLIVIMIISILAAAVLGVAAVAGETAREAKTRAIISRIHSLLMEQYDTYANRRVKLRPAVLDAISAPAASLTTAQRGQLKAETRLYALREMILTEVPCRWSDVLLEDAASANISNPRWPIYLAVPASTRRTELGSVYLRHYRRLLNSQNKITNNTNTMQQILDNEGAECLYMVVMNACGDGESRTLFPESSIADTDGDGAPEFIDGWGHPIEFLRWAPGYESDIQLNANELDNPLSGTDADAWAAAGSSDHDPLDLYRADASAFRLVPLVYSAGRDEALGLAVPDDSTIIWTGVTNASATMALNSRPKLLPWAKVGGTTGIYVGTDTGEKTATDNLHNHLIRTR